MTASKATAATKTMTTKKTAAAANTAKPAQAARSGAVSPQAAAPIKARLAAKGAWQADAAGGQTWHGELTRFEVEQAGMGVRLRGVLPVSLLPQAQAPAWQWQIGAATLEFLLPSGQGFVLRHEGTRGRPGRWETRGSIARLAINPRLIHDLRSRFGAPREPGNGRVKVAQDERAGRSELVLAADWNLKFDGTLQGDARIRRLSGDVMIPGSPPVPLGLRELELDAKAVKAGAAASRLDLALKVDTAAKGTISANASTQLRTSAQGGLEFGAKEPVDLSLHADIADLAWLSLFAGDDTDLGGSLHADVKAARKADGTWATQGTIGGSKIKLVRLDDGVRLFDGTLQAHLDGQRLVLDKLQFPARLRVDPKEWRTSEWVHTSPDAKNGSLTLTGDWDLMKSAGAVNIELYRYPILQRSDRYAMISGKLRIDAEIPRIGITGSLTADAGWFDLDMLSSVPTLDGDVVVVRAGQEAPPAAPMDVSMDLTVDLGPRFYITGYGLDSGLVGSMRIVMAQGKLTAEGALRTRGGSISAYGQHLQLRRGTITFQGDIGNPVLNIEALRTGVAVEAGVRVAGTAKRPRIDLVSYPDVSDVEKLSWLLLGRAPDEGGGDTALLLSLGTSLLGGGAPLYRKLGLDEVSIQSGELGSTGSLLPVQTVVNDINNSSTDSALEQQFVRASKKISTNITLSIEQALSQTGTVGRLSYHLSKGLSAELSAGTVNGIALVYRTFFKD
ncbi:translocation/assembly module TamB domain-containing protein [Candidimonas humi]|nr:translocation/assembly module TamB domain-containing protein [Candidimonas humi]